MTYFRLLALLSTMATDRVIWGASVTAFFILAVFFTTNAYTDWQENLVITTLKNTAKVTYFRIPVLLPTMART